MTKETPFLSTYARTILSQWQGLAQLIHFLDISPKQKLQVSAEGVVVPPALLSQRAILNALSGPYADFFQPKFTSYCALGRLQLEQVMYESETFKRAQYEDRVSVIPSELMGVKSLDLAKVQEPLEQLTRLHYEQFHQLIMEFNQQCLIKVSEMGIEFSDQEAEEFYGEEPPSDLNNRFIDLGFGEPSIPTNPIRNYISLKAFLLIHSTLGRLQQHNSMEAVNSYVKKLSKFLPKIDLAEKALLTTQNNETQRLMGSLLYALNY